MAVKMPTAMDDNPEARTASVSYNPTKTVRMPDVPEVDNPDNRTIGVTSSQPNYSPAYPMPDVPSVTNPRTNAVGVNATMATAIRIDDNDVSVRQTWSSDKINNALAGSATVEIKRTAEWNSRPRYIPIKGTICIYSDYKVIVGVAYPNMKIADGLAYIVDQPFVVDGDIKYVMALLEGHVNNDIIHITAEERARWNTKVNVAVDDMQEKLTFSY